MMPRYFATVYAKPGVPMVDTFITESARYRIYFPWDLGFSYQKPIAENATR